MEDSGATPESQHWSQQAEGPGTCIISVGHMPPQWLPAGALLPLEYLVPYFRLLSPWPWKSSALPTISVT